MPWFEAALRVLQTAAPLEKCAAAEDAFRTLNCAAIRVDFVAPPLPTRPSRPDAPRLCSPSEVPKRRFGSKEGRAAVLHALANIELNAIDLAFDMAARFAFEVEAAGLSSQGFVLDWFRIGAEEAGHFAMISARLNELGSSYGAFPAHDGLWDVAIQSSDSVLARLAIVPLVLEARGLDVTPEMVQRFRLAGDEKSAEILEQILKDEVSHVAAGVRWFEQVSVARELEPAQAFRSVVKQRFRGALKPPFNMGARDLAGLPASFYADWNVPCGTKVGAEPEKC